VAIEDVIDLLEQEYGPVDRHLAQDPLDVLIGTILSQNTSDVNSGRTFSSLKASFDSWEAVVSAPVEDIAKTIKSGGLSQIKAARIKQVLGQIEQEQGRISLDFLNSKTMAEAKDYLMRLPGVGHKTASCVLLFSLEKPSLPVDTHVLRVSVRLGLVSWNSDASKAQALLEKLIPQNWIYQFHLNLIAHGRMVCKAANPLCQDCVLLESCEFGKGCFASACAATGVR